MSLRDDVTQPVSLADELRKLVELWRKLAEACWRMWAVGNHQAETFKRCADELSALLAKHAVAGPSRGLLSEPVQAFIRSNKGVSLDLSSYQDGDDELPVGAHAAEQPKLTLTEEQVQACVKWFPSGLAIDYFATTERLNRLLTSPVAPPPRTLLQVVCPECGYDFPPRVANYPNAHCPNCRHNFNYAATNAPPVAPGEQPPRAKEE